MAPLSRAGPPSIIFSRSWTRTNRFWTLFGHVPDCDARTTRTLYKPVRVDEREGVGGHLQGNRPSPLQLTTTQNTPSHNILMEAGVGAGLAVYSEVMAGVPAQARPILLGVGYGGKRKPSTHRRHLAPHIHDEAGSLGKSSRLTCGACP